VRMRYGFICGKIRAGLHVKAAFVRMHCALARFANDGSD
jgi:hypothetical protein